MRSHEWKLRIVSSVLWKPNTIAGYISMTWFNGPQWKISTECNNTSSLRRTTSYHHFCFNDTSTKTKQVDIFLNVISMRFIQQSNLPNSLPILHTVHIFSGLLYVYNKMAHLISFTWISCFGPSSNEFRLHCHCKPSNSDRNIFSVMDVNKIIHQL